MSDPVVSRDTTFAGFLRSAGKLAFARQLSALLLVGVIMTLPVLATRTVATDFAWAYFSMLTLSSLLGLGLERLAGTVVATRGEESMGRALAPLLFFRLAIAPVAAVSLWLLLAFVGVTLSAAAWWATLLWVMAALLEPVLFGGLRAAGNSKVEPAVMFAVRAGQAAALAALAASGAPVAVLVASVALLETVGAAIAFREVGPVRQMRGAFLSWRVLPLRRALALAGIDIVGLVNLRLDLLLVGRMLGATLGATYGLLYRAVDGFNGVVGSAGLWLYAESSNERDGGTDPAGLRARSLVLLPRLGVALGLVLVVGAGTIGDLVPRLGAETDTLRFLAAAFPLLTINAIELHVRSGRGRNREVLRVNAATLAFNVPLCILLIVNFGLPGAAIALVLSELWQAMLLWVTASADERSLVGPSLFTATTGAIALVATGAAIGAGHLPLALMAGAVTVLVVVSPRGGWWPKVSTHSRSTVPARAEPGPRLAPRPRQGAPAGE